MLLQHLNRRVRHNCLSLKVEMPSIGGRKVSWDAENRPITITLNGVTTTFAYDGDGKRLKKVESNGNTVTATVCVGNYIEHAYINNVVAETVRFYYDDAQRIAMRRIPSGGRNGVLTYIFSDHLGGTSVMPTRQQG